MYVYKIKYTNNMSYTTLDAYADTNDMMLTALHSTDAEYVMEVAQRLAGIAGWEEEADILRKQALQLRRDEWSYDESINN